jgi:hypothetical protein
MLGHRFAPRIRGLHKQRIYRINMEKDYGPLASLVCHLTLAQWKMLLSGCQATSEK